MPVTIEDAIDPDLFRDAWRKAMSRPGMGAITLRWHPYLSKWECVIDYADNTQHEGSSGDINEAIRLAVAAWEAGTRTVST